MSDSAKKRLEWILFFAKRGCSVSDTCTHFGISRSTLHRWLERFDPTRLSSLEDEEVSTQVTHASAEVVAWIRDYRTRMPLIGKEKIRELLAHAHGVHLSSSTVGRVIERECLYFANTPLHWRKRMARQHTANAQDGAAHVAPLPAVTPQIATESAAPHSCMLCALHRFNWKPLLRTCVLTSVLMNIAFLTFLMLTAMWEKKNTETTRAALIETPTISDPAVIDAP